MQSMTTLAKVFDQVDALSKSCTDRTVKVKELSFDSLHEAKIGSETHQMKPIAQASMAWRLGIPIQYLRKCPPEVQAYNMNHWIEKERNEELFFRFDNDEVRAIFTLKYKPVDNFEVLERLDSMGYGPETEVQCSLDSEFMALSIVDKESGFKVNGDEMRPGVSISNSEVGLASLSIAAFILRLICTNGMVSRTEVKASYRHVSGKILDEFPEALERIKEAAHLDRDKFRIALDSKVENPPATIENFNRQFLLNRQEAEIVLNWGYPIEAGNTMFHVINAYTRAAQFEGLNAESSYKLQKVGGMILGMVK